MKRLRLVLLVSLVFAFTLAMAGFASAAEKCPICGMKIEGNENTIYEITFTDGKT